MDFYGEINLLQEVELLILKLFLNEILFVTFFIKYPQFILGTMISKDSTISYKNSKFSYVFRFNQ